MQARRAEFRYTPDVNAGITERSIAWSFLNPKAGITYALTDPLSLYASYGKNSREPARNDMFAGLDNLDTIERGRRRRPRSREARRRCATSRSASRIEGARLDLRVNVYSMDFRNEIAPIGALSFTGSPLRQNVGASYRRGIEADVTYRAIPRVLLTAQRRREPQSHSQLTDASQATRR